MNDSQNSTGSRAAGARNLSRRTALGALAGASALAASCAPSQPQRERMALDLADPVDLAVARQKVIGSVAEETLHTFLRFHFYGQVPGQKAVPLLSMNNYIIDYWEPVERGTYKLRHYEVGYYTEFDTDIPLDVWKNPYTDEEIEVFRFVLGPIYREYSPETVLAPGLAPIPLTSHVIGNRLFVATQAISSMPNLLQPEEWPKHSSGPQVNWLSAQTYSADLDDVLDPALSSAPAHVQLQNFVSWSSWMQMGQMPGGTTARAFGTEIAGFDALPADVLAGFRRYTPEIFETASWDVTRFDEMEYLQLLQERRAAGDLQSRSPATGDFH